MKFLHCALAACAISSLYACTSGPPPTAPTAVVIAEAHGFPEGFEPAFYRAFLQNAYESPDRLEPVRLLPGPFRIYVRAEDDAGRAVDLPTLETTEATLLEAARIWSGDAFGIVNVTRGAGTREKVAGWITVKWTARAMVNRCGRSTVGVDGGFIELDATGACSCGMTTRVYPRVVRHELGHAMGYYHTDDRADVMYGQPIGSDACDGQPSARERLHARIAHSQAR